VTSDHPFSVQLKKSEKKSAKVHKKKHFALFLFNIHKNQKTGGHWSPGHPTSLQNFPIV
jgi:hypothetical protein